MTVCIAGINQSNPQPYIISACDRKISFMGGWSSAEGIAMKITGINRDWTVMFSGPTSPMTALIEAISEQGNKMRGMDFRAFARACRHLYMRERKLIIESEVLGEYDIDSYAEYEGMRKSDPQFYAKLKEKIDDTEAEWSLLFAGFDGGRRPHLFTITGCGKISFCDKEGYAAIGSGAWRALLALSAYPFRRAIPFSEAIFGIVASKFYAEAADGVGEETILTVLEPKSKNSPVFWDNSITSLRKMWRELPRFPGEKATGEIWKELKSFQDHGWLIKPRSLKPSIAEKLEMGQ